MSLRSTLRLVPLAREHLPVLARILDDPQTQAFTRVPQPLPEGWLEEWLTRFDGHDRFAWAVLDEADGELVGYAVTGPVAHEEREVELGYAVAPWARGRGIATETLLRLSRWALDRGMQRVTALISVDNPASSRVASKAGYSFEGVLRSVHHRGEDRVDLESWSLLPGELRDGVPRLDGTA